MLKAYGKNSITYVRNFTDIDDKINNKSLETGRPIKDITSETIQWYMDDMAALGNLEPDLMPRATDYIPQMINYIERLIEEGFAYAEEGHVLFSVSKYKNYGFFKGLFKSLKRIFSCHPIKFLGGGEGFDPVNKELKAKK